MKGSILSIAVLLFGLSATAQKFAYVDTDYILKHMPEYAEAQGELNRLSSQWQEEIEAKYEAAARLQSAYNAEKVLLTSEMRKKREEEIDSKMKEARELQKKKFGVDGELFSKREELVQPVQDMIFEAIKEISSNSSYMVIFDKSNQSNMLYTNPKYDVSDKIIKKMGYTPGETIEPEEKDDKGNAPGKTGGATNTGKTGSDSRGGGAISTKDRK
jgi:outer membrane protein